MSLPNKEKYEKYKPLKFLGQNFLVDDNIAAKIVNALNIAPEDNVVEIGAGYGALTKHILQKTKNYIAVEIDDKCIEALNEKFGNINIISKDYLKTDSVDFPSEYKIIGNIPYNITSKILFKISTMDIPLAIISVTEGLSSNL